MAPRAPPARRTRFDPEMRVFELRSTNCARLDRAPGPPRVESSVNAAEDPAQAGLRCHLLIAVEDLHGARQDVGLTSTSPCQPKNADSTVRRLRDHAVGADMTDGWSGGEWCPACRLR